MRLSELTDSPCGLDFYIDSLGFSSALGRKTLLESRMMTEREDIERRYSVLKLFHDSVASNSQALLAIQDALQPLKDISVTLNRLSLGATLDEIQLFEVKRTALIWEKVRGVLNGAAVSIDLLHTTESLEDAIDILDPEKQRIESFYIYDCYSQRLGEIRAKLRLDQENADLQAEEKNEELSVLQTLSERLQPMAKRLDLALKDLAWTDVFCAAASMMRHDSLCIPKVSENGDSLIVGYSNPQVEAQVVKAGGTYQYCDVRFHSGVPTVVIGANMGGKSVTLKTVALCQYLFQFGLPLPACNATLCIQDRIFLVTSEERPSSALSSFGNEIKGIDSMLRGTRNGEKALVLLDEPCRSTNPVEGAAMVEALADLASERKSVSLILATHYCISPAAECKWLRVAGMENGKMNYTLLETSDREVPHEALNIARSLDADEEWLDRATRILNKE
jgi:DNA mismatch repair protein MutS2